MPSRGRHRHRRRRRRRGGYVLLLTLVILALAATVTAGVCRSSLAKAARSARAAEELQQRWAAVSCKRAFLPNAEEVLAAAERAQGRPLASCQARLTLGGQTVDLAFGDETAKLNVNDVVRRRGKAQAEQVVAALVREAGGGSAVRTRLLAGKPQAVRAKRPAGGGGSGRTGDDRGDGGAGSSALAAKPDRDAEPDPVAGGDDDEPDARPLQSFGQLFPDAGPAALFGSAGRPGAAGVATCWGDGQLHPRRAPEAVLARALSPPLTAAQAGRLARLRQRSSGAAVEDLLTPLKLSEDDESDLADRLSDESNCHSLWVVTSTARRSWYLFAVDDESGETVQDVTFSW